MGFTSIIRDCFFLILIIEILQFPIKALSNEILEEAPVSIKDYLFKPMSNNNPLLIIKYW